MDAPPSARSSVILIELSRVKLSRSSVDWKLTASRAARQRCARVDPLVRPWILPRAKGSQCGAPSPVKAGTKTRPLLSLTDLASSSNS